MEKEFIPYKLALGMKQLGFDEPCLGFYDTFNCEKVAYGYSEGLNKAPTFSQAFRWFREKYNLHQNIDRIFSDEYGYTIIPGKDEPINAFNIDSYEEAELACLQKLIEIVKQAMG